MIIESKDLLLIAVREKDRDLLFDWAVNSEATYWWYGEHVGEPIPSRTEFFEDFDASYFDDSVKDHGWFIIEVAGKKVGMINYQPEEDEGDRGVIDFDILIPEPADTGKGIGSKAILLLLDYLVQAGWKEFLIHTLVINKRAQASFLKAGFSYERDQSEKGIQWSTFRRKFAE